MILPKSNATIFKGIINATSKFRKVLTGFYGRIFSNNAGARNALPSGIKAVTYFINVAKKKTESLRVYPQFPKNVNPYFLFGN